MSGRIPLSPDQVAAVAAVMQWFDTTNPTLTLGGYAGTGKSTVVRYLLDALSPLNIRVCAYTGKAVSVLRRKGISSATTMHQILYAPNSVCEQCDLEAVIDDLGNKTCRKCETDKFLKTHWVRNAILEADLVIVDEASMLAEHHVRDLQACVPKILYVGDHGQLEPLGNDPAIMRDPEIRLEQVHRQAEGSAILDFAHLLRRGSHPSMWEGTSSEVLVRYGLQNADLASYDAVVCGFNNTRTTLNERIRMRRGFDGLLEEGERVICLQNDSLLGIWNGMLGQVTKVRSITEDFVTFDFVDDNEEMHVAIPALRRQFGASSMPERRIERGLGLFDYGYAMTCHKLQGSEFDKIAVLEQIGRSWDPRRWRYTAATRACKTLHYFLSIRS